MASDQDNRQESSTGHYPLSTILDEITRLNSQGIEEKIMSGGLFTWISETMKSMTDSMVIMLLRSTSRFENELTQEGREEQSMWRERRTRNIKGLALRAKRRHQRSASF